MLDFCEILWYSWGIMWKKQCPKCSRDQFYNRADHLKTAVLKNTICYSCHSKETNTDHRPMFDIISSRLKPSSNGCLIYTGGINEYGYGMCKRKLVHRTWWKLHNGPIPNGMCILHHCDNPPCCNINHLFLGTQEDNMHDMANKGRANSGDHRGIKNGNYKHGRYVKPVAVPSSP
jgi:hypothetical protein